MSAPKHTAGRWEARFEGYADGWTIYGIDGHGDYLVAEDVGGYADTPQEEAEQEAVARLIAAAPDLLGDAERRVRECDCNDGWRWVPTIGSNGNNVECHACGPTRAAIAKATGADQ